MILSIIYNIVLRRYLLTLLPFQILSLLHFIDLITSCVYIYVLCVYSIVLCVHIVSSVYRVYRIVCVSYRVCVLYRVYIVLYHICIVCVQYRVCIVSCRNTYNKIQSMNKMTMLYRVQCQEQPYGYMYLITSPQFSDFKLDT